MRAKLPRGVPTVQQRSAATSSNIDASHSGCYLCTTSGAGALQARNQEDPVLSHSAEAAAHQAAGNAPTTNTDGGAPKSEASVVKALLDRILTSLQDDKAEEIVTIDLAGKSTIADHMVICSGRSSRQVGAIAEKLVERVKQEFGTACKVEGKEAGDWVLIDTGDVIVHVFRPEVRDFYQLEKMWQPVTATT